MVEAIGKNKIKKSTKLHYIKFYLFYLFYVFVFVGWYAFVFDK